MKANSSIIIVQATDQHIPIIQQLGEATFYPTYLPIISQAQVDFMFHKMYDKDSLKQQMAIQGHYFFIAYNAEMPIGFASCELNIDNAEDTKLHKLYVLPNIQNKGTGKQLLTSVEHFAKQKEQKALLLNVNRHNNAKGFYAHLGYSIILEEDIDIGNGYFMNDYRMKKSLT